MHIKELTSELEPGVTLLIGSNGAGKISLLITLNVVLEGMFVLHKGILRKLDSQIMIQKDIKTTSLTAGDVIESMKYHVPILIRYEVDIEGKGTKFTTYKLSEKCRYS